MVLHNDVKNGLVFSCPSHPVARHWLPIGRPDLPGNYLCGTCRPPSIPVMVERWHGEPGSTAARQSTSPGQPCQPYQPCPTVVINYERPICPACHCRWVMEVDLASGLAMRCWSCKAIITADHIELLLRQPRPLPLARRRVADAAMACGERPWHQVRGSNRTR